MTTPSPLERSDPGSPFRDPLGILASTAYVIEKTTAVRIDREAVTRLAAEMAVARTAPPPWDAALHFRDPAPDGGARTAGWIFALDALNFCFWSEEPDPDDRWCVAWRGETHDGYNALAAALSRAVEEGRPLWDARWLAGVSAEELQDVLRPVPGSPGIPLFAAWLANLHELGAGLLAMESTGESPVATLIARASGSAPALVQDVVRRFPSFNDVAIRDGREIRFYKRAQILVADLAGALEGDPLGSFHDLASLTAFADYKVPQVLQRLGILVYEPELLARIRRRDLIPAGSDDEIAIRAATIQACEAIRLALQERSSIPFMASEVDWLLWNAGQSLPVGSDPYHRTLTVFY
ncbi:MAG TPA: queuosine salvage family protein [Thermomicrobiales bacterium]|nr:queuosine salvage family protein [Thermomicrobiales bacterium]